MAGLLLMVHLSAICLISDWGFKELQEDASSPDNQHRSISAPAASLFPIIYCLPTLQKPQYAYFVDLDSPAQFLTDPLGSLFPPELKPPGPNLIYIEHHAFVQVKDYSKEGTNRLKQRRLHCQSASLIGCEDNNTVIFTLTLQSSRNSRAERKGGCSLNP
ncbi:hypothetical protein CRENBAI_009593 [Crenichthys baileyi]|uniref:DET1- and DDB1-associated protein 1 n=1 Tax=Crenichthys baileyi TaxID=28760 RepID=A0AAV9RUM5_9TELE